MRREEKLWKDEKQGLTFCHTKTIMRMWRNKNRYGEDRKTKVGKCKKKVLSIRVEDSMYKCICDYARKHKMTVTEVVLQGLEKVLNRPE